MVTGHYARVITTEDGNRELHRAADWAKDQSYVLGVLTHEQQARLVPPRTPLKTQVRAGGGRARLLRGEEAGLLRHLLYPRR